MCNLHKIILTEDGKIQFWLHAIGYVEFNLEDGGHFVRVPKNRPERKEE